MHRAQEEVAAVCLHVRHVAEQREYNYLVSAFLSGNSWHNRGQPSLNPTPPRGAWWCASGRRLAREEREMCENASAEAAFLQGAGPETSLSFAAGEDSRLSAGRLCPTHSCRNTSSILLVDRQAFSHSQLSRHRRAPRPSQP